MCLYVSVSHIFKAISFDALGSPSEFKFANSLVLWAIDTSIERKLMLFHEYFFTYDFIFNVYKYLKGE